MTIDGLGRHCSWYFRWVPSDLHCSWQTTRLQSIRDL